MVHLAGGIVEVGTRVIQRCQICGYALINDDLSRMAVPEGCSPPDAGGWAVGAFVRVTKEGTCTQSTLVARPTDGKLPPGSCISLVEG